MPDAEIKYYSMEKGIQKKKKIPWNEYLKKIKLTQVVPKDLTNLPGQGNGQVVDYFIWNDYVTGTAEVLRNGDRPYLREDLENDRKNEQALYGWGNVTDHAPVLAEIEINIGIKLTSESTTDELHAHSGILKVKATGRERKLVERYKPVDYRRKRIVGMRDAKKQSKEKKIDEKRK